MFVSLLLFLSLILSLSPPLSLFLSLSLSLSPLLFISYSFFLLATFSFIIYFLTISLNPSLCIYIHTRVSIPLLGAIPLAQKPYFAACIFAAVTALHNNGLMHRFVTPESVYITTKGVPMVISNMVISIIYFINLIDLK